jgi:hypothetical protein
MRSVPRSIIWLAVLRSLFVYAQRLRDTLHGVRVPVQSLIGSHLPRAMPSRHKGQLMNVCVWSVHAIGGTVRTMQ